MTCNGWANVPLGALLSQISREEMVRSTQEYRLLGARWYAKGLYVKDVKLGSSIRANRLYRVERGDFVYNRLFAWKGSFAVASKDDDGCYVSNEFPCFKVNESRLSGKFLWYYLSNETIWNEVLERSSGGTPISRNRLKEDQFLSMQINLPNRNEQDRIAAKLDTLTSKIEEAKRLQSSITEEVHSIVMGLHHHASADRSVEVGSLLTLYENREPTEPTKEYPQVGIRSFGGGLFAKSAVFGLGTTYKHFNRLEKDMVVLSQVKGWEGAIAVCPAGLEGYYASPEYRTFRCVEGQCHSEYMKHLVRTPWFHEHLATATRGQGARRERTRPEMFLSLRIPMPTYQRQGEVVRLLDRLESIRPYAAEIETEFSAMLPSILDKALKGQL